MTNIFETAGKKAGLQIWRVENFALASVPASQYGSFYNGDCYILLNSIKSGSGLLYNLHYWIGEKSSQGKDFEVIVKFISKHLIKDYFV
jgi:gelsolin